MASELQKASELWMKMLKIEHNRIVSSVSGKPNEENKSAIELIQSKMNSLQKEMHILKNFTDLEI